MDWFNGVKRQRLKAVTEIEYIVAFEIGVTKNMIISLFYQLFCCHQNKNIHFTLSCVIQRGHYFTLLYFTFTDFDHHLID